MGAIVAIQKVKDIDNNNDLRNKLHMLLEDIIPLINVSERKPRTVLIKVNICFIKGFETGVTVDPKLVYWLCEWLCEKFEIERIFVAEADATHLNAEIAFKVLGWNKCFSGMEVVTLLNLSRDVMTKVDFKGLYFKNRDVPEKLIRSDLLISFAKLKTHDVQGITCIMKNQFGALPEKLKILYHPFLAEVIVDAVKIRPPDLCIVDGIIGHQGAGPVSGIPMPAGILVAGTDAVATDHACARLMRIDPLKVPHIKLAMREGFGMTDYKVIGVPISEAREKFLTVPLWRKYIKLIRGRDKTEERHVSKEIE